MCRRKAAEKPRVCRRQVILVSYKVSNVSAAEKPNICVAEQLPKSNVYVTEKLPKSYVSVAEMP